MKITKYVTWIGLTLLFPFVIFELTHPSLEKIEEDVYQNNDYSVETPFPEKYDSLCKLEDLKDIYFPKRSVKYAKLTKNDFWKSSKIIDDKSLSELLVVLNDSASYSWGELGTPEIHYFLTYYDQNDNCIGLTTIDLEGMAYSYPALSKMKWGSLNNMEVIDRLVKE